MILILGLASIFLIIPAIYLSIPFSMLYAVVHMEDRSFMDAMKRCLALARNNWWWTFGVVFVLGIIEALLGFVAAAPSQILAAIQLITATDGSGSQLSFTMQIITIVLTTFGVLVTAFLRLITLTGEVFVYASHRERLEGTSLLERIDNIGQPTQL